MDAGHKVYLRELDFSPPAAGQNYAEICPRAQFAISAARRRLPAAHGCSIDPKEAALRWSRVVLRRTSPWPIKPGGMRAI